MKKILFAFLSLAVLTVNAQDKKEALARFSIGNYEGALEELLELYEVDKDAEYAYMIGVCYINTNIDKSAAVPYFEHAIKDAKANENAQYLLGRAFHYAYQFDDAVKAYRTFKTGAKSNNPNLLDVDKQIEYCENAKELMKFPVNVSFENLGKNVNSVYPDYYPFIPTDESFIIYNSKREEESDQLPSGQYLSNIYLSSVKDGEFEAAKLINFNINSKEENEEVVGLNAEGDKVILYKENYIKGSALFESRIVEQIVDAPLEFPKTINSKFTEIAASFSFDGGKIYFASDRPGGYGGIDIYMCQKLPNGKWSQAQNLGPTINTKFDEDFPNISPNGKVLYFSSRGHTSMGGYDIFRADWNKVKNKFGGVRNIGYPINTPEDNMNFRVSKSGRFGYISALRKGGFGDLDIYRVTFREVEPEYTVITGKISAKTAGPKFENAIISVTDEETGDIYGDYIPNLDNMRYVMILPPGRYEVFVGCFGYEEIIESLEILDKSSFQSHIEKDIKVTPVAE